MESPTSVGRNFFFFNFLGLSGHWFLRVPKHIRLWGVSSRPLLPRLPTFSRRTGLWKLAVRIENLALESKGSPPLRPRPELLGLWVNECIFWNWWGWNLAPVSAGSTMSQAPAFIFKMWSRMICDSEQENGIRPWLTRLSPLKKVKTLFK